MRKNKKSPAVEALIERRKWQAVSPYLRKLVLDLAFINLDFAQTLLAVSEKDAHEHIEALLTSLSKRTCDQALSKQMRRLIDEKKIPIQDVLCLLTHRAGYSYREIGSHLDLHHNTVKRKIEQAQENLAFN